VKRICLLVALAAVVGCSPDEQAHQQAQAKSAFDEAYDHLSAATAGYITHASFDGSLEEFQRQQLEQAGSKLTPIVRDGSPDQQVAASMALAAVESARARRLAQHAAIDWAKQSAMSREMINTLAGAKHAQTLVDAHNAIEDDDRLEDINAEMTTAQRELRDAEATIRARRAEIQRLTDRREQLEQQRLDKATRAAEVRGRAFESTGQLRFDLHQQATDLARQADQLGVQADRAAMQIGRLEAELAIAEIEKQQAEDRIASLQAIIDGYEARKRKLGMSLGEAQQLADQLAGDLVEQLRTRAEQHTEQVADPYTEARNHYGKAVNTLQSVRGVADADSRPALLVDLAGRQSELAFTMRAEAIAHQAFADLLSMIADQARSGFPKAKAATIKTMADDAVDRGARAKAETVDALDKAAELLADADGAVRGDRATRRLVLQQQARVLNTLADVSGDEGARQRANGAAAELRELDAEQ